MTEYGVNIVGSLTNNNGILSGFSINNYAQLNTFPTFNSVSTFEAVAKIKMLTYPSESYVMIYASANGHPAFNLYIYQNGNVAFDIGNRNSWVVDSERGTKVLSLNTWYWIKVAFTGTQYILSWSEDGTTWTQDAAYSTTTKVGYGANYNFNIGISRGAYDSIFSNGEIDLTESYIKLDNNIWWRGEHKYIGTHIQLRRDTTTNWTTFNPILLEGEVGLELDTGKSKRGDGSTAWNSLAYDKASTALQSHQSLANYVDLSSTQTITGLKTFNSIKTNTIYDTSNNTILKEYSGNVTVGNNATTLTLRGTGTRPQYRVGTNTATDVALYSDIPTVPTNISAFTNDSGYITGITSSDVTTALGYTPTNTDLSNLSSTGQTVLDGQWVAVNRQIASDVSVNGSTDLTYTLSDVPNDGNKYEVLLTGQVYTSNTSGNQARIQVSSDIVSTVYICAAVTRASQSAIAFGSAVIPVGNRQITVARDTGWNGAFNLYIRGYRRIGSNS